MPKICGSITKQLKNTLVSIHSTSSSSSAKALVKFFSTTKSKIENPSILTRNSSVLYFSRTLAPNRSSLSNSFAHTRLLNLSFNSNHPGVSRNYSSLCKSVYEVNQRTISSSKDNDIHIVDMKREDLWTSIPVRAYFLSNRIDLRGLMDEIQTNVNLYSLETTNYLVLGFGNSNSCPQDSEVNENKSYSYMVVFPYGSTVTFNMLDPEIEGHLKVIQRHASGLLPEMIKDAASFRNYYIDYEIRVNSNIHTCVQGGAGHLVLQHLDMDGIRMIGCVLGQSIALDYYARKVDEVLAEFRQLHHGRKKIKSFLMRKQKIYQLVGKANSNLAYIIFNLGLFERIDIAWKEDPNYSRMWHCLRDQFELTQKLAGLDFYIRVITEFIRFSVTAIFERSVNLMTYFLVSILLVVLHFSPFGESFYRLIEAIIQISR